MANAFFDDMGDATVDEAAWRVARMVVFVFC